MSKFRITYLVFILVLFFEQTGLMAQLGEKDKAQMIIDKIAPLTYWKNEAAISEYTIGVYGSNTVYNELVALSAIKKIKDKPFSVINFKRLKDYTATHILFVSKSRVMEVSRIIDTIEFNTLLITDEYAGKEFMVNFIATKINDQYIKVSTDLAKKSGIRFDDQLLKYGVDDVLRALYNKTANRLKEDKEKLERQQKELESQKEQLRKLRSENKKERDEIDNQKVVNLKQRNEIDRQKKEITQQREKLIEVQRNLNIQNEKVNNNIRTLNHTELRIKEQEDLINQRNEEIQQQLAEIERDKRDIQSKDIMFGQLMSQGQFLDIAVVIGIILIVLIIILTGFIYRGYQVKQKINDELRIKNIAINRQKEEISNQQKQTELLNKELEKLSIVASQTDNAVSIMNREGNFEWVNVGFTRMYGYTLQLLINELDENIRKASANPEINQIFDRCIAEKKTIIFDTPTKTRSGKAIWIQTSLTPILDAEGEINKLITIETDITRIKKAEEEIRLQHKRILEQSTQLEATNKELEKLSLVASETENAISIMDAAGNFQWINDGYTRLFGYTFSQLINEYSRNIITKDIDPHVRLLIKKCIETLVPVTYESPWKSREGKDIWVQTTLTPLTDKKKNIRSLIAISSDISKLKFAEQEIRQQSEELMAQKEELIIQKDHIEQQNINIKSSISYAKTIQSAILPPISEINKDFESFVIYKPKDIVSGDFYWYTSLPSNNGKKTTHYLAVVDCTGHGVPGAFMSMIGSQLLNELIVAKRLDVPSRILETMNTEIVQSLRQQKGENNDGMDVCFCKIEKGDNGNCKVIFAGAKRPLYYFSHKENRLNYIKGTRKTIGGTQARRNKEIFMDHELYLDPGDLIYLSTDGIIDQPSPDRIRYGSLRLIDLMKTIGNKSIKEQKAIIEKALDEYQQYEQQRDDVTFIGLKI